MSAPAPPMPSSPPALSALRFSTARVYEEYSKYDPPTPVMGHVGAEYKGLSPGLFSFCSALEYLVMNAHSRYPLDPRVAEAIADTHGSVMIVARKAEDVYTHFLSVHSHDIMHLEEPRKGQIGEAMWNIFEGVSTDGIGIRCRPSVFQAACFHLSVVYSSVFAPRTMQQVYYEVSSISESIDYIAQAIQVLAKPTEDRWPVHQTVTDMLNDIVAELGNAASEASNLMKIFRSLHSLDLAKKENPRKGVAGEREWDV